MVVPSNSSAIGGPKRSTIFAPVETGWQPGFLILLTPSIILGHRRIYPFTKTSDTSKTSELTNKDMHEILWPIASFWP